MALLKKKKNDKEIKFASTICYADDWHEFTLEPTKKIEDDNKNIFIFIEEVSDGD